MTVICSLRRRFDDLYRYCYLVASVVGLVCIRIFGYSDARAEKLAEKTGVAFQLTNILRDVKEDAGARPYLSAARICADEVRGERRSRKALVGLVQDAADERAMFLSLESTGERYYASGQSIASIDRCRQPRRTLGAGDDLSQAAT